MLSAAMLPALLLAAASAMIAYGWWRGRSLAGWIAGRLRGGSRSRSRATFGWAAGIAVMYGATSLAALALLGRPDALTILPVELRDARAQLGIAPIAGEALWETGAAISAGFALGALFVVVAAWRGWRPLGPSYRSPAMAATRGEVGAALLLSAAAGIGEELFFRIAVPLLAALVCGNGVIGCVVGWALFTLAHRYQGRGGMAAVSLVGAVLAWLYLATGALWIVALLHALVDANALIVRPWLDRRLRK
jgi:membrane protease YdiL (CAAX protease family)